MYERESQVLYDNITEDLPETLEEQRKPPHSGKELGDDSTKCPGEGYVWKGNGPPESGCGNWVKGSGEDMERLFPDLNHLPPVLPHWDYTGPDFPKGVRLYLDGTYEIKVNK